METAEFGQSGSSQTTAPAILVRVSLVWSPAEVRNTNTLWSDRFRTSRITQKTRPKVDWGHSSHSTNIIIQTNF